MREACHEWRRRNRGDPRVANAYLHLLGENADPKAIAALFAEDVDFDIAGDTATVPWIGRREGRSGVAAFFAELRATTRPEGFDVTKLLVDGDTATIVGSLTTRVNATGRLIDSEFAIALAVRDGAIVRYRLLEAEFEGVTLVLAGDGESVVGAETPPSSLPSA